MSDILKFLRSYPSDAAAVMSKARVAEAIAEIEGLRLQLAYERERADAHYRVLEFVTGERDALRSFVTGLRDQLERAERHIYAERRFWSASSEGVEIAKSLRHTITKIDRKIFK